MNQLLVVYAFLIPISHRAKSAILVMIILLFIIRGNYIHYLKEAFYNKIVQAFLLFLIMNFIWLIGTDNTIHAKSMLDEMKVAIYPLLFISFLDKKFSFKIIIAFLAGVLYSEIFSISIFLELIPPKLEMLNYEIYKSLLNDPSPFLSHGRYSIFLSFAISLLLYFLINNNNNKYYKVLITIFIITTAFNISIIGGRIGYIAFTLSILFVIILKYKRRSFKPLLLILFSLSLFFIISFNYSKIFESRINKSISSITSLINNDNPNYNTSIGLRIGFWVHSMNVIYDNLLFGVGTGDQMDEVKNVLTKKHHYISHLSHPHNEYINVLLQFGLIGFIIFLNIFYQILKYKQEKYKKNMMLIVSFIISISLISSILNGKFLFAIFVVLISALISKKEYISQKYCTNIRKELVTYIFLIVASLFISLLQ